MVNLGKVYKRILDITRNFRPITWLIFGIPVWDRVIRFQWDITTLVLKRAIDEQVPQRACDVLDMGCGHLALLAQYVKKRWPDISVVGVDVYEDFVRNAALNAKKNGLDITILHGDLFEPVGRRFDVILFNPPYVPAREPTMRYPLTTFSGFDGTDTIQRFLRESAGHLKSGGRILLGVNSFHVPPTRVIGVAEKHGFQVERVVARRFNTAKVFVLRGADSRS